MKVLEARNAFFSDYETLQFLSKLQRHHHWDDEFSQGKRLKSQRPYNHPQLQAITSDTLAYLNADKGLPQEDGTILRSPLSTLNDERFTELVRALNKFDLFQAEKLQIVNQLPGTLVHLYAVVEECDARFTQDQQQQLIELIQSYHS